MATLKILLQDCRVDPVPLDAGESLDDTLKRTLNMIEYDSGPVLLL